MWTGRLKIALHEDGHLDPNDDRADSGANLLLHYEEQVQKIPKNSTRKFIYIIDGDDPRFHTLASFDHEAEKARVRRVRNPETESQLDCDGG